MEKPIVFRKFVPIYIADEYVTGPSIAIVELTEDQIKRIHSLVCAIKELKVTYIEEFDYPTALMVGEIENPGAVTDKTSIKKLPLLINDENPVTAILAKRRLAGDSVSSEKTFEELRTLLSEWEGSSECDMIKVGEDDFHYKGYIKHTSVEWSTEGISLEELPRVHIK